MRISYLDSNEGLNAAITYGSGIVSGSNHTLCLKNNKLYAWGLNDRGQLGDGTTINKFKPVFIKDFSDEKLAYIECGEKHSVVLTEAGKVYVWGDNHYHQLGLDTLTAVTVPTLLNGFSDIKVEMIACGSNHTLAIAYNNGIPELYAWGGNSSGQLGNGNKNQLRIPTKVKAWDQNETCTGIACGNSHSVAIISGNIWVWGDNSSGQLGLSKPTPQLTPYQTDIIGISQADEVRCGAFHTAIKVDDKSLLLFGDNTFVQLGNEDPKIKDPNSIVLNDNIIDFSCGMYFNIVLISKGIIVWGDNSKGQLGVDPNGNGTIKKPTQLPGLQKNGNHISTGSFHSSYMDAQGTSVYSTGLNTYGQLGDNTQIDSGGKYTQVIFASSNQNFIDPFNINIPKDSIEINADITTP